MFRVSLIPFCLKKKKKEHYIVSKTMKYIYEDGSVAECDLIVLSDFAPRSPDSKELVENN